MTGQTRDVVRLVRSAQESRYYNTRDAWAIAPKEQRMSIDITSDLAALADPAYQAFQAKLVPTVDPARIDEGRIHRLSPAWSNLPIALPGRS